VTGIIVLKGDMKNEEKHASWGCLQVETLNSHSDTPQAKIINTE
jgi:hypothetical protein